MRFCFLLPAWMHQIELLKEAKEKGIRITYIDSYTKEELQDLTVATDNVNAGRMLGEYAKKINR